MENRSRFPLEVLEKVIHRVGSGFPVLAKLNLSDGIRGGFSLEDCKYVSGELEKRGCSAIVLSGGFTSKSPFYLMRGKVPLGGMIRNGGSLAEKFEKVFRCLSPTWGVSIPGKALSRFWMPVLIL